MDTNGVAQSIDQYVWGPGSACAPLVCLHDGNANGSVTDGYPTDWRRYYLTDANGNVTTMIRFGTDPFGYDDIQDVTRVIYTAYGTATEMGENWLGAGDEYALDGPLYCGYWHDTENRSVPDPEPLLQPEPLDVDQQGSDRVSGRQQPLRVCRRRSDDTHGSDGRKSDHSRGYIGLRMVLLYAEQCARAGNVGDAGLHRWARSGASATEHGGDGPNYDDARRRPELVHWREW